MQSLPKKNFDKEWIRSLNEYYKEDKEKLNELETVEHTQVVQLLNSFYKVFFTFIKNNH